MDDNLNAIVMKLLNVKDMGTYYTTDNKNNAFTKADIDNLVRTLEIMIVKDVVEVCTSTMKHFKEIDEISPDVLKSTPDQAINRIVNKIATKYKLKKSKAL